MYFSTTFFFLSENGWGSSNVAISMETKSWVGIEVDFFYGKKLNK
jgi:hypothetical protein